MSLFLKFNDGCGESCNIWSKSAAWGVRLKSVGESRLLNFLTEIAKPCMADAAIHQTASACVAIRNANKLICRSSDRRVERGVVSRRNRPPNIHLTRGTHVNSNKLAGSVK